MPTPIPIDFISDDFIRDYIRQKVFDERKDLSEKDREQFFREKLCKDLYDRLENAAFYARRKGVSHIRVGPYGSGVCSEGIIETRVSYIFGEDGIFKDSLAYRFLAEFSVWVRNNPEKLNLWFANKISSIRSKWNGGYLTISMSISESVNSSIKHVDTRESVLRFELGP